MEQFVASRLRAIITCADNKDVAVLLCLTAFLSADSYG
jgi:hypothetical protein